MNKDFNDTHSILFNLLYGEPKMKNKDPNENTANPQEKPMNNTIIKYVRKKDNTPIACLIAIKINDEVKIGWSMFHAKEEVISFSKEKAKKLALSRARNSDLYTEHLEWNKKWNEYSSTIVPNFPSSLKREIEMFMGRARRYFEVEYIQNYSTCKMHAKEVEFVLRSVNSPSHEKFIMNKNVVTWVPK